MLKSKENMLYSKVFYYLTGFKVLEFLSNKKITSFVGDATSVLHAELESDLLLAPPVPAHEHHLD